MRKEVMPMSDCIFCKIVSGEIPSYKVYEDEDVLAFLDLSQVSKGHTLVIPKEHVTDIYEYEGELAGKVFAKVPLIARAIKATDPAIKGMNVLNNNGELAGQSVFHSHLHILPRYEDTAVDGFGLKWRTHNDQYGQAEFDELLESIKSQLEE